MRSYRAQGPLPGFYHYYPGVPAVVGVRVEERVNFCPAVWNTGLSADPPLRGLHQPQALHPRAPLKGPPLLGELPPLRAERPRPLAGKPLGPGGGQGPGPPLPGPHRGAHPGGAYAAYELELLEVHTFGDHDLFVGRVVAVWEEEGLLDEKGRPKPGLALLYYGKGLYGRPAEETFAP